MLLIVICWILNLVAAGFITAGIVCALGMKRHACDVFEGIRDTSFIIGGIVLLIRLVIWVAMSHHGPG